jgi:hypothetical protein
MIMIRRSIAILIASASVAFAQNPGASSTCWRARPLSKCKSWIITEAALEMPAASSTAKHLYAATADGSGYVSADFETRLAFTFGAMVNSGARQAFGGTVSMLNGDLPGRIEARYRGWLGPEHGVDLSAGFARTTVRGVYDPDELQARGITASAGISGTYIGADARLDLMRASDGRVIHGIYVTARTGSRAAPIAVATGFVLYIAAFALLVGPDY